ncbi:hypothetical protein HY256_06625 [Candidatus Sumerlaeota bacterium]|nr:hypothetical protein [Candidatus Sumerlaeota bacterium]
MRFNQSSLRTYGAFVLLVALSTGGPAQQASDALPAPPSARGAIGKGLAFLQKEAFSWKTSRGCAACHHAPTMIWPFNEARSLGFAVDEKALKELTDWAFSEDNAAKVIVGPRTPDDNAMSFGAVYLLMAVEAAPAPPNETTPSARRRYIEHIFEKQIMDGSWVPMDQRQPVGGTVEDVTVLTRIALMQSGDTGTSMTESLRRAGEWLEAHPENQSRQGRNLRLLMAAREGKSPEELKPIIAAIESEQNTDGGWSQTPDMGSDAYATGQALYVLAAAGAGREDASLARGVEFLLKTQTEEGNWTMISRAGAKNLSPITSSAAAWGVLGLLRASADLK